MTMHHDIEHHWIPVGLDPARHLDLLPEAVAAGQTVVQIRVVGLDDVEAGLVAGMFGGETAGEALWAFSKSLDAPTALKDLGVSEADLDHTAGIDPPANRAGI